MCGGEGFAILSYGKQGHACNNLESAVAIWEWNAIKQQPRTHIEVVAPFLWDIWKQYKKK